MNGLRIYTHVVGPEANCGNSIFYSRRADGPYYRWSFQEQLGQWHSSRMHAFDIAPKELCVASWKGVPSALQASLKEHYLD
jgi:hypothetical protein